MFLRVLISGIFIAVTCVMASAAEKSDPLRACNESALTSVGNLQIELSQAMREIDSLRAQVEKLSSKKPEGDVKGKKNVP